MKGLLTKDFYILKQRKQTFLIFIGVCIIMGFTSNGSFLVGYMCFLSAFMAVSTIAYDDADNGMPFLMTLPVERKTYALSKYVLGGIFCFLAWVVSLVVLYAIGLIRGTLYDPAQELVSSLIFFPLVALMLDLTIPIQLKYGAEKSRTVMFILFGGIAAILVLGRKVFFREDGGRALLASLENIPGSLVVLGLVGISVVLTLVSLGVSRRIMEKKTF